MHQRPPPPPRVPIHDVGCAFDPDSIADPSCTISVPSSYQTRPLQSITWFSLPYIVCDCRLMPQSHEVSGQFTGHVRAKIKETRAGPHDMLQFFAYFWRRALDAESTQLFTQVYATLYTLLYAIAYYCVGIVYSSVITLRYCT